MPFCVLTHLSPKLSLINVLPTYYHIKHLKFLLCCINCIRMDVGFSCRLLPLSLWFSCLINNRIQAFCLRGFLNIYPCLKGILRGINLLTLSWQSGVKFCQTFCRAFLICDCSSSLSCFDGKQHEWLLVCNTNYRKQHHIRHIPDIGHNTSPVLLFCMKYFRICYFRSALAWLWLCFLG